jgi:spermidine synthase
MAPHGNRRATVAARTGFGVAELKPDPARPRAWTLFVDGVPQSYVDLDDPDHVAFDYLARLLLVVRLWAAPRVPLKVLHLGGGAMTLARAIASARAGSAQTVVDRDGDLLALVSRVLPAPAGVEVVIGDARAHLEELSERVYDVIVADVFEGAWMPDSVATTGFAAAARRALRPRGLLAMNVTDVPPLSHTRIQVATLQSVFADVAVLADPAVLRGRKAGNAVLVAADTLSDLPVRAGALHGPELTTFRAGARARLDASG